MRHHQPGRTLVIDRYASNQITYLRALGFQREKSGRYAGKLTHRFPSGIVAHSMVLEFKLNLEDMGVLSHMEFQGKPFAQCTMYCLSERYPHHTQQCLRQRGKKYKFRNGETTAHYMTPMVDR